MNNGMPKTAWCWVNRISEKPFFVGGAFCEGKVVLDDFYYGWDLENNT